MELLSKQGWTPNREVSIPQWLMEMPPENHAMCAESEKILRHLGGLEIYVDKKDRPGPIKQVDFLMHPDSVEDAQDWSELAGEQLYALGLVEVGRLYVNAEGACFAQYYDLWKMGNNIDEALMSCFFGEPEWISVARYS